MPARSFTDTWGHIKLALKRKSSASSAKSASSNSSQISDDPNGPIYSALQSLFDLLLNVSRNFTNDWRFRQAHPPLEAFVDQITETMKSIKDSKTSIALADAAHSVLVRLYDDTKLLSKEIALDVGINRRKRVRYLNEEEEEARQDVLQKIEAFRKRFEEWSDRYLSKPTIDPVVAQEQPVARTISVHPMNIFSIAGFMDGTTELFRSSQPDHYFRLIEDRRSGVLTTEPDAPVQIKLEPEKIKRVERALAHGACVVTIIHHPTEEGGEGKVWTMLLGRRQPTGTSSYGRYRAWRLCRRLSFWNSKIICPALSTGLDGVRWRFDDASGGGSSNGPAT